MLKILPTTLFASTLILASLNYPQSILAGTCASQCGVPPIQFTPGKPIRIKVINTTANLVNLEKVEASKPISLQPGQEFQLDIEQQPNISLVFWDESGLPLQAIVSKPNFGTLRIELRRGKVNPGDRSLDILNNGRVKLY